MDDVFIGRQPILDKGERIFAYELLFRSGQTEGAHVVDNVQATARVMVNALNNMGIKRLIGEKMAFINVDEEMLKSGALELLPTQQTVLEILETVELNDEVIGMCRKLRRDGYQIALDDFVYQDSCGPMLAIADYVKVDVLAHDRQGLESLRQRLGSYRLNILAEKVETKEDFYYLREHGFSSFQGYFFARPSVITAKSISTTHTALIELLRLLSVEAEIYAIEQSFKRNPDLGIKLLTLMNSTAYYSTQKVTSVKQSIALLGYRKLKKWVTLLLFAGTGEDLTTNPLLERAAIRGRVAELLAKRITAHEAVSDSAFITGVLTLVDVLFMVPMEQALKELNLADDIQAALLRREGFLGALITITEGLERDNLAQTGGDLAKLHLTLEDLFSIEKTAILEYENYGEGRD